MSSRILYALPWLPLVKVDIIQVYIEIIIIIIVIIIIITVKMEIDGW